MGSTKDLNPDNLMEERRTFAQEGRKQESRIIPFASCRLATTCTAKIRGQSTFSGQFGVRAHFEESSANTGFGGASAERSRSMVFLIEPAWDNDEVVYVDTPAPLPLKVL
ncbi:hypothetical protein [Massilia sp. TN1-12]|uniref:hypothetical protein n=1 Tax=Massilia paldalensis TaxID=3377675 RepID=UPI00384B0E18